MTHVAHLDISLRYPVSHIAHSSDKQILVITNSWLSHIPDTYRLIQPKSKTLELGHLPTNSI